MPRTILRHLHLPNLTSYHHASRIQNALVSQFLSFKASPSTLTLPPPTIITFESQPVYTFGRRELRNDISEEQRAQLERVMLPRGVRDKWGGGGEGQVAEIHQAERGGQITFHGPGQLVIYPIMSLSRPASLPFQTPTDALSSTSSTSNLFSPLSPRCYVSLLEQTTIRTLAKYCIESQTTNDPGVWLPDHETKVAALGVHLRRNITSHGVGLNVRTDLRWFERIVACGLIGKKVGSIEIELKSNLKKWADLKQDADGKIDMSSPGGQEADENRIQRTKMLENYLSVEEVGRDWVDSFAQNLCDPENMVDINRVSEEDIWKSL